MVALPYISKQPIKSEIQYLQYYVAARRWRHMSINGYR